MKKLYSTTKGPTSPSSFNALSALPAALIAPASALSSDEQQVLAYLLTSQKHLEGKNQNHPPDLCCSCFGCYKSFWARWDASPNRHVIHLIIDAFEEEETHRQSYKKRKRKRKKNSIRTRDYDEIVVQQMNDIEKINDDRAHDHDDGDDDEEEEGKSSVTRFVGWEFGINN